VPRVRKYRQYFYAGFNLLISSRQHQSITKASSKTT
jgi:hypothetical protein